VAAIFKKWLPTLRLYFQISSGKSTRIEEQPNMNIPAKFHAYITKWTIVPVIRSAINTGCNFCSPCLRWINSFIYLTTNLPINQPLNHSVDESVNQPIKNKKAINYSINQSVTNNVASGKNKWSTNHYSMHRLWLTLSRTQDRDRSKSCAFNFVFGLIISLYTESNATNKHCYWLP